MRLENDYNQNKVMEKTQLAHMGEYVISTEEKNIIGTSALDTCYGMVLYDRERKFGIVGHGYESNAIPLLEEIIDIFPKYPNQVVKYAIIPGYRTEERKDRKTTDKLLAIMEKVPNAKQFKSDLGVQVGKHLYYEFAFDVRIGHSMSS